MSDVLPPADFSAKLVDTSCLLYLTDQQGNRVIVAAWQLVSISADSPYDASNPSKRSGTLIQVINRGFHVQQTVAEIEQLLGAIGSSPSAAKARKR